MKNFFTFFLLLLLSSISIEAEESSTVAVQGDNPFQSMLQSQEESSLEEEELASLQQEVLVIKNKAKELVVDFRKVFEGSPLIYTVLSLLSIITISMGFYTIFSMTSRRMLPRRFMQILKNKLENKEYTDAFTLCKNSPSLLSQMVASGIATRHQGYQTMVSAMEEEGKRLSGKYWRRIGFLSDIAMVAPMLGLLGTVLGMFYAFYDIHRSLESVSYLFDGLGISVGTTVCGLLVAIIAMILHSMMKYRLLHQLAYVEKEVKNMAALIETT